MGQPWGIYYIVINQTMVKASTSDVLLMYFKKRYACVLCMI